LNQGIIVAYFLLLFHGFYQLTN